MNFLVLQVLLLLVMMIYLMIFTLICRLTRHLCLSSLVSTSKIQFECIFLRCETFRYIIR
nr:MAG TPA: hypothetical protein [Crassvirales sp.]